MNNILNRKERSALCHCSFGLCGNTEVMISLLTNRLVGILFSFFTIAFIQCPDGNMDYIDF